MVTFGPLPTFGPGAAKDRYEPTLTNDAFCRNVCSQEAGQNVTKSKVVLPKVCGAIFFIGFGLQATDAKNDRKPDIESCKEIVSGT